MRVVITAFMLVMGMGMFIDAMLAVSGCTTPAVGVSGIYHKSAIFRYNVDWATNTLMFMLSGMAFVASWVLIRVK